MGYTIATRARTSGVKKEDLMNQYRYERSEKDVKNAIGPVIFLAGPTVRGNQPHLTSWRFEACEEFKRQRFTGSLIIPEFTSKTESDKDKDWIVEWENNGLTRADCIMFWIPRTRELLGLTTNFELGYWLAKCPQKIIYGRPNDAYRIRYQDLMWCIHFGNNPIPLIYETLEETIKAAIDQVDEKHSFNNKKICTRCGMSFEYAKAFESSCKRR